MIDKKKLLTAIAVSTIAWANMWLTNAGFYDSIKTDANSNYVENNTDEVESIVPKEDESKVNTIATELSNTVEKVELNDTSNTDNDSVENAINALPTTDKDEVTKSLNVSVVSTAVANVPLNNLSIKDYYVGLYYKAITSTKISTIKISTDSGIVTVNTNLILTPWQEFIVMLTPWKINITSNGKIIFTQEIATKTGTYSNIEIDSSTKLYYEKVKIEYIGEDLVESRNSLITDNTTLAEDNISKTEDVIVPNKYESINKTEQKNVVWDKNKWQFVISTNTTSQSVVVLSLDPTLVDRLGDDKSIYDVIDNFRTVFNWLTFVTDSIDYDGNTGTKEVVFKDTNNTYYIYQIKIDKVVDGVTTKYNMSVDLLYKGTEDVTNVNPTELDGNTATKEWYIQNKDYTAVLQYIDWKIRRVLYAPNTKIYFNKLLTKDWVQWKVLVWFNLDTTAIGGKYYIQPFLKLYWYDADKQKYFVKQVEDWTSYDTFKIKIDWNYIYFKEDGTVDYAQTDYMN